MNWPLGKLTFGELNFLKNLFLKNWKKIPYNKIFICLTISKCTYSIVLSTTCMTVNWFLTNQPSSNHTRSSVKQGHVVWRSQGGWRCISATWALDPSDSPLPLSLLLCGSAMPWLLTASSTFGNVAAPAPGCPERQWPVHLLWTEAQRSGGREKWCSVGHVPPLHYSSLPGSQGCQDVVPPVGTLEMRDRDREVPEGAAGQTKWPMSPNSSASSLHLLLLSSTPGETSLPEKRL